MRLPRNPDQGCHRGCKGIRGRSLYLDLDTDATGAAAMQEIRSTGALEAETEEKLKGCPGTYTEQFLNTKPEKK